MDDGEAMMGRAGVMVEEPTVDSVSADSVIAAAAAWRRGGGGGSP
jgi:hypothetical protein